MVIKEFAPPLIFWETNYGDALWDVPVKSTDHVEHLKAPQISNIINYIFRKNKNK